MEWILSKACLLKAMLIQIQTLPECQENRNLKNMSVPSLESEHHSILAILDRVEFKDLNSLTPGHLYQGDSLWYLKLSNMFFFF